MKSDNTQQKGINEPLDRQTNIYIYLDVNISHPRGLQSSASRESPAALFTVEDEVEKAFVRKKSFFNKKASKSSVLTVWKLQLKLYFLKSLIIFRMMAMMETHQWPEQVHVLLKQEPSHNCTIALTHKSQMSQIQQKWHLECKKVCYTSSELVINSLF